MQIPVNTNIDNYKDDFFKGFSAKETAYAGVILLIYLICYTVLTFCLFVPQTMAMYLSLPLPLAVGLAGMAKVTGHDVAGNLLKKYQIAKMPVYYYHPSALTEERDRYYLEEPEKSAWKKNSRIKQVFLQMEGGTEDGLDREIHAGL